MAALLCSLAVPATAEEPKKTPNPYKAASWALTLSGAGLVIGHALSPKKTECYGYYTLTCEETGSGDALAVAGYALMAGGVVLYAVGESKRHEIVVAPANGGAKASYRFTW